MKYLVIYNTSTGEIVMMSTVRDESEPLNGGLIIEVPEGKQLEKLDVTDPDDPKAVFSSVPESETEKFEKRIVELDENITNTQLALVELYEGKEA